MSLLVLLQGLALVSLAGDPAAATWQVPGGSFAALVPALQVELLEGTTVIATGTYSPTATAATSELALSTGERNSITDWSNLRVRLTKSGGPLDVLRVQLETPVLQESLAGDPAVATWGLPSGSLATGVGLTGTGAAATWALPGGSLTTAVALTGTAPAATWGVVDATPVVAGLAVAGDPAAASWGLPSGTFTLVGTPVLGVELLEGTTVRASWTATTPVLTALTESFALSTGERNSIGDWGALRVRLTKSGAQLDVLRVQVETPAAGSGVTLATATATATWGLPGGALATDGFTLSGDPAAAAWGVSGGALTIPGTATLQVDLLEGEASRASWTINPGPTASSGNFNLSTPQRDSIGDWGNLRVRLTKSGAQVEVSFARLEAPVTDLATLGGAAVPSAGWGVPEGPLITGLPLTGTAASASWTVVGSALTASGPTLQLELLEGTTPRATFLLEASTSTDVTDTFTLTTEQRDAIGNWGNLRVRLTQQGGRVRVYDLELELPDALTGALPLGAGVATATWVVSGGAFTTTVALGDAEATSATWGVAEGSFVSGLELAGAAPFGRWAVPLGELTPSYLLPTAAATWGVGVGSVDSLVALTGTAPAGTWSVAEGTWYLGLPLGSGPAAAAAWGLAPASPLVIKFRRRNWDERAEATASAWTPRPEAVTSGWLPRTEGDV